MEFIFRGVRVSYHLYNEGKTRPLVLLHGWGRSKEDFDELISFYQDKTILVLDFPPFGESEKYISDFSIYTYVSMVISLCEHLNIENADFLGHSFGGRILMILACVKRSLVHSCIFVDSAGLKPKRSLKYRFSLRLYKLKKRLGIKTKEKGSADYRALSPEMKKTFKSIVNTHLNGYAKHIKAKSLIIWGLQDIETPLYMAKKLNKYIKNSRLEVMENGGHFCFKDCALEFFSLVYQFVEMEEE